MSLSTDLDSVSFEVPTVSLDQAIADYLDPLATNTKRTREFAFKLMAKFFADKGVETTYAELMGDFDAWAKLDGSFLYSLMKWMSDNDYSRATAGTVKAFALAQFRILKRSGIISPEKYATIFTSVNNRRNKVKYKKAWYGRQGMLTAGMVDDLKNGNDLTTLKGVRDKLLMCLLLNHGLRCGEVSTLFVSDLNGDVLAVKRHKTGVTSKIKLSNETMQAFHDYIKKTGITEGYLIRSVNKGNNLGSNISNRAIGKIVQAMGRDFGITLSPHDCRHYWATKRAADGATALQLMKEGGWTSLESVMIYVHDN